MGADSGSRSHPIDPRTGEPKSAGNAGKKRSVHIDGLVIFTNKCRGCGQAFSVNVKDLGAKTHGITVACPYCGVKQWVEPD